LGTGSIGECVRQGKDVKHFESLLLPGEFASIKDSAKPSQRLYFLDA